MSRALNKLSESAIRSLRPTEQTRLSDGGGLYLFAYPTGRKVWRFMHYDSNGKQKTRPIGEYPACGLAEARRRAGEMRDLVTVGRDPDSAGDTIEPLKKWADIILNGKEDGSLDGKTRAERTMKRDRYAMSFITAQIGDVDIRTLTPSRLDDALRKVDSKETRYRCMYLLNQLFTWAMFKEVVTGNPASSLGFVHRQPKSDGYAFFSDPKRVGKLLLDIQGYRGSAGVEVALEILLRTAMRPGELRYCEWAWVDLDKATIALPEEITKIRQGRTVYLSRQTVALFKRMVPYRRAASDLVFPGQGRTVGRGAGVKPLSDMALTSAIRRMGYDADTLQVHGFRKLLSTAANESGEHRPDVIEAALGHVQGGIRSVYNKAKYEEESRELSQWWSDKLDAFAVKAATAGLGKPSGDDAWQ